MRKKHTKAQIIDSLPLKPSEKNLMKKQSYKYPLSEYESLLFWLSAAKDPTNKFSMNNWKNLINLMQPYKKK